ncbi:MAG TPA: hypothetical protein VED86_02575 [archaeon]|nr:hypothetical protein [archaeon]
MPRFNSQAALLLALCVFFPAQAARSFDWPRIKVVSLYESIIDTNTTLLSSRLTETHIDLVFRAYFRGFQRNLNASDYYKLAHQVSSIKNALITTTLTMRLKRDLTIVQLSELPLGSTQTPYTLQNTPIPTFSQATLGLAVLGAIVTGLALWFGDIKPKRACHTK